jgi:sterol 3beta-glucosyltransferase
MRIAIIALGSRGDIQPYIALGKGLKKAGHVVRLVTHQSFEGLVNSQGLEFWPARGGVGPAPISRKKLTAERLAQAIQGL